MKEEVDVSNNEGEEWLKPWFGQLGQSNQSPFGIPTRGRLGFQSRERNSMKSSNLPWLVGQIQSEPWLVLGS